MEEKHGFFLCEEKYIKDTVGLLIFLAKQINEQFTCIYCQNYKTKSEPESVK